MFRFAFLVPMVLACQPEEDTGFGGGGSNNTPTDGKTDTGDGVSDGLPSGWEAPQDTDGPSLRNFVAIHDEYPNLGDVIEANVEFWDAQDNVDGGSQIKLTLNGGDWTDASATAVIGGADGTSWVEDGKIWFVIANVWNWETYTIDLMATDKQGNRSNVVSTTAEP